MPVQRIPVSTASAGYDISLGTGLLAQLYLLLRRLQRLPAAGAGARPRARAGAGRMFVVSTPRIWKLWSAKFLSSFPADAQPPVLLLPDGEPHKRLAAVERLAEQLAAAGADRGALLIAFGGGVVGDVTGFLAAIYMRGVEFVQVPTTLLAQVDSSVGGKTGVNLAAGKNLVGSFHQPRAVYADLDLLSTLPPRERRAGLQEAIKAGIIHDAKLFSYLTDKKDLVLSGDLRALARVVAGAVRVKAEVVSRDEREAGPRMVLNFGHTVGHAIEAAAGYGQLLHGEAVGWGMIAALHLGRARGTVSAEEFARMANVIFAYGPLPAFAATARRLVALSAGDKKNRGGRRRFVLPVGIGSVRVVEDVTEAELLAAVEAMLEDMKAATGRDGAARDEAARDRAGRDRAGRGAGGRAVAERAGGKRPVAERAVALRPVAARSAGRRA